MLAQSNPMGIMRQFLAAFAGSDRNDLFRLLAPDASLKLSKRNTWLHSDSLSSVVDFLLAETKIWSRRRIDVQSWSSESENVVVKFHAEVRENGRLQEKAYTLYLKVEGEQVQSVGLHCDENVAMASPVWGGFRLNAPLLSTAEVYS